MVNKKNMMLPYISPFWSCSLPKITFATYNHASSGPLKALGFRTGSKGLWVFFILNREIGEVFLIGNFICDRI